MTMYEAEQVAKMSWSQRAALRSQTFHMRRINAAATPEKRMAAVVYMIRALAKDASPGQRERLAARLLDAVAGYQADLDSRRGRS